MSWWLKVKIFKDPTLPSESVLVFSIRVTDAYRVLLVRVTVFGADVSLL